MYKDQLGQKAIVKVHVHNGRGAQGNHANYLHLKKGLSTTIALLNFRVTVIYLCDLS